MYSAAQQKEICDTNIIEVTADSCSNVKIDLRKSSANDSDPDK
jgi:hypothetical protein